MTNLKHLLKANQFQLQNIINHSFNQGLFSGNLPTGVYQFFVDQDTLYLNGFEKVLKTIARKVNHTKYRDQFRNLHEDCVKFEESMLTNTSLHLFKPVEITSCLDNYLKHLFSCAASDVPLIISIAAIFPCFWIYCELGKYAMENENYNINDPTHPYKDWLETYTDPTYVKATEDLKHTFEHLLALVDNNEVLDQVRTTFAKSFKFEYDFFNECCTNLNVLEIESELTAKI